MKSVLSFAAFCVLLAGCSSKRTDPPVVGEYDRSEINVTENKVSQFFSVNNDFQMSDEDKEKLKKLLIDSKGEGIENVGFMIVSNSQISTAQKAQLSEQVKSQMIQAGFMESRIVDSGICVYKDAKRGVRVDILKYDLQRTDTSLWKSFIGDSDIQKPLPKYGNAMNYNMEEMMANNADLIVPRKYKGQQTGQAISAMSDLGGGSSSSGSSNGK